MRFDRAPTPPLHRRQWRRARHTGTTNAISGNQNVTADIHAIELDVLDIPISIEGLPAQHFHARSGQDAVFTLFCLDGALNPTAAA